MARRVSEILHDLITTREALERTRQHAEFYRSQPGDMLSQIIARLEAQIERLEAEFEAKMRGRDV